MKANQLRIGNIVLNPNNNKTHKVTIENISDIENGYLKREPIPLTEECLLKFGFEVIPESSDEFRYIDKKNGFSLELSEYYKKDGRAVFYYNLPNNDNHICISYCKYVHQLQNLYYALTGTELNETIH